MAFHWKEFGECVATGIFLAAISYFLPGGWLGNLNRYDPDMSKTVGKWIALAWLIGAPLIDLLRQFGAL